jgi:hypothetical protein
LLIVVREAACRRQAPSAPPNYILGLIPFYRFDSTGNKVLALIADLSYSEYAVSGAFRAFHNFTRQRGTPSGAALLFCWARGHQ